MTTIFSYTIGSTNLINSLSHPRVLSALSNLRVLWTGANYMFYCVHCQSLVIFILRQLQALFINFENWLSGYSPLLTHYTPIFFPNQTLDSVHAEGTIIILFCYHFSGPVYRVIMVSWETLCLGKSVFLFISITQKLSELKQALSTLSFNFVTCPALPWAGKNKKNENKKPNHQLCHSDLLS